MTSNLLLIGNIKGQDLFKCEVEEIQKFDFSIKSSNCNFYYNHLTNSYDSLSLDFGRTLSDFYIELYTYESLGFCEYMVYLIDSVIDSTGYILVHYARLNLEGNIEGPIQGYDAFGDIMYNGYFEGDQNRGTVVYYWTINPGEGKIYRPIQIVTYENYLEVNVKSFF